MYTSNMKCKFKGVSILLMKLMPIFKNKTFTVLTWLLMICFTVKLYRLLFVFDFLSYYVVYYWLVLESMGKWNMFYIKSNQSNGWVWDLWLWQWQAFRIGKSKAAHFSRLRDKIFKFWNLISLRSVSYTFLKDQLELEKLVFSEFDRLTEE
jgi:hypothetical protein